jgi:hypothetical protein
MLLSSSVETYVFSVDLLQRITDCIYLSYWVKIGWKNGCYRHSVALKRS